MTSAKADAIAHALIGEQASIAVVSSVQLWLAFLAAICFRQSLALAFSHLTIFRL
jgi:hypothetical protein